MRKGTFFFILFYWKPKVIFEVSFGESNLLIYFYRFLIKRKVFHSLDQTLCWMLNAIPIFINKETLEIIPPKVGVTTKV